MPAVLLLLLIVVLPELAVKTTALHMLVVAVDYMQPLKFMFREEYF